MSIEVLDKRIAEVEAENASKDDAHKRGGYEGDRIAEGWGREEVAKRAAYLRGLKEARDLVGGPA